jgi:preprotein translocase subunit SecA
MRIFGSERIAGIMDRLGAQEGEVISHSFVTRAIGNAQKRVEARNFEIRKHLKEYDDVMNLQRKEIYGLRQRILKGEDIKDEILDQLAATLESLIYKYTSGKYPETWLMNDLYRELQSVFGVTYHVPDGDLNHKTQDSLFDEIWKEVKARYEDKEQRLSSQIMRQFERGVFLMVIDNLWKDHLYEMDHLKGGVQYRAFGQKNPLYEYQREGVKMFEELRDGIARDVTSMIFRLEAVTEEEDRMGLQRSQTVHGAFDIFSSSGEAQPEAQPRPQQQQLVTNRGAAGAEGPAKRAPVVRTAPAVGRNDPCPCGSGKKYKKCHGAS